MTQYVGNTTSASPDIVMIEAQGRSHDEVYQDVQDARRTAVVRHRAVPVDHTPVQRKLLAMRQAVVDRRGGEWGGEPALATYPKTVATDTASPCPQPLV